MGNFYEFQVQEQFLGDLLILRAAKPIAAGEAGSRWNLMAQKVIWSRLQELMMSYVSTFQCRAQQNGGR